MAETSKEQAKNSEIRSRNTEQTLKSEKGITAEKERQQRITDDDVKQGFDLSKIIGENAKKQKEALEFRQDAAKRIKELDAQEADARRKYFGQNQDIQDSILAGINEERDSLKEGAMIAREKSAERRLENEILEDNQFLIEQGANSAKAIGDNIESFVKKFPGGEALTKALGVDELGDKLEKDVGKTMVNSLLSGGDATKTLNVGFDKAKGIMGGVAKNAARLGKTLMRMVIANPILALVAAAVALFSIIKNVRSMQRKFAGEVGISRDQVGALAIKTKAVAAGFNAIGLDGSKIQGTLKNIVDEFGSLENMTVSNAANIERFAQNAGVGSSEVVKLNKLFMDLEGLSFDAATNVSKAAVDLAKAAGVSTAKVIGDMSSAASQFAKFSTTGAEGMAKAAVEAAKVGASLTGILNSVDSLINFEDSLTKQFEAQVLTGRQINTEKARQLALDGDIAGLTSEIQSIVGGVGDIQSLNVIQRKSVADAIGISVGDLLKISRGEQVAQQETVQDKLTTTNKLLAAQEGDRKAILEATLDNKNINMNDRAF